MLAAVLIEEDRRDVTHEEYRRYLESLGEADLLDEARRVARADLGRWDMSPRYIAVWYACADRGMAAQFTAAVHEVRSGRRQQDADNRQRLGALGTTLSQGGHSPCHYRRKPKL